MLFMNLLEHTPHGESLFRLLCRLRPLARLLRSELTSRIVPIITSAISVLKDEPGPPTALSTAIHAEVIAT